MKKVVASGVFDILHPGHIYYLREAKKLGDHLTVILARDKSVETMKGKKPIKPEEERRLLISELKCVDEAILGNQLATKEERKKILQHINPDIIALGYDQKFEDPDYKIIQIPKKEDHSSSHYLKRS